MEIEFCKGIKKYIGLMFAKPKICIFEIKNKKYIWHSFFVFYPIFIYFFNRNLKLIEKTILKPFNFYKQKKKAFWAIEIPKIPKLLKNKQKTLKTLKIKLKNK